MSCNYRDPVTGNLIQVAGLGGNGGVEIPFMTKLWENPAPTASFASQTITLASSDYDFLVVEWAYGADGTPKYTPSVIVPKGNSFQLNCATSTGSGVGAVYRNVAYSSATTLQVSACYLKDMTTSAVEYNTLAVPLSIYGLKKSYAIEDVAIANVSTSATQCIMSDNVTTVEQAITALQNPGSVSVTADGVKTYEALINSLYSLTDFSKLNGASVIKFDNKVFHCMDTTTGSSRFSREEVTSASVSIETLRFTSSSSRCLKVEITTSGGSTVTTFSNYHNTVPASGMIISLIY